MDDFVIVYIDDILVYSKIGEKHARHFKAIFGKLRDNKLYANKEKMILLNKRLNSWAMW